MAPLGVAHAFLHPQLPELRCRNQVLRDHGHVVLAVPALIPDLDELAAEPTAAVRALLPAGVSLLGLAGGAHLLPGLRPGDRLLLGRCRVWKRFRYPGVRLRRRRRLAGLRVHVELQQTAAAAPTAAGVVPPGFGANAELRPDAGAWDLPPHHVGVLVAFAGLLAGLLGSVELGTHIAAAMLLVTTSVGVSGRAVGPRVGSCDGDVHLRNLVRAKLRVFIQLLVFTVLLLRS
mmetsp:Transcript_32060/g.76520  ORF Transcript_32060/g.76520 Transcript_32060/m.76520 type:complete len:232 (+) Transcript_32060:271-966(+)